MVIIVVLMNYGVVFVVGGVAIEDFTCLFNVLILLVLLFLGLLVAEIN